MRRKCITVNLDRDILERLSTYPLVKDIGKSAFIRHTVNEYVERKEAEKRELKDDKNEK